MYRPHVQLQHAVTCCACDLAALQRVEHAVLCCAVQAGCRYATALDMMYHAVLCYAGRVPCTAPTWIVPGQAIGWMPQLSCVMCCVMLCCAMQAGGRVPPAR